MGFDFDGAVQQRGVHRAAGLDAEDAAGEHHLRPKAGHLGDGALGQIRTGQALGKSEIVLNGGALTGLPAGGLPFDDHGAQALGCRIDGGGQTGRAATHDAHVVETLCGIGAQP